MLNIIIIIGLIILFPEFIRVIDKCFNITILSLRIRNEKIKYQQGRIDLDDLHYLTPHEFEEWCGEFLEKSGYTDIKISPLGADCGKDIICQKNGETIYVECKRYSPNIFSVFKVDSEIVQKLVGAMVHDHVNKGLIITTGKITNDAKKYNQVLPAPYAVDLIHGDMLIEKCISGGLYKTT